MSKKDFNPYRDMLDIPSLTDENPTDYQLLGVDDFESDSGKIADAHEKRMQRIAELYQTITKMSQQIDDARDRISDSQMKEEYDNYLRKTGRAGVAKLGKVGALSVLFSFVLSIFIVVVSTFYIYPMVVAVPVENIGDSVETLPEFANAQMQKESDFIKSQQEDVSTMDPQVNIPINVDEDITVDFSETSQSAISGKQASEDDLTVPDVPMEEDLPVVESTASEEVPAPETPAIEESPAPEDVPAPETPAIEEPVAPEDAPAPETPAIEESPAPETPAIEELPAPETPAIEEPAAPEDAPAPETPAIEESAAPEDAPAPETPAVEEPAAPEDAPAPETPAIEESPAPEDAAIVKPSEETPDISVVPESPDSPSVPDAPADSDTPTVPKISDIGYVGIPELPPLEGLTALEPPVAPQPPVIPELASAPEPVVTHQPQIIPEFTATSVTPSAPSGAAIEKPVVSSAPTAPSSAATPQSSNVTSSGIVLEDVDKLDQFVQMGQKARTSADFEQLLSSARQAEEELMKEKQFQKAQQIADVVYSYCARFADKSFRAAAFQHKEIVARRAAWWDSARAAEAKMQAGGSVSPGEANIVARWKIEVENDWETGLKYLALNENEQIQLAVKRDLAANPENVRHCLIVANDWWNLALDPVPMQKQYRQRAGMWYAKALPSIEDKQVRTLVEKRISMSGNDYSKR